MPGSLLLAVSNAVRGADGYSRSAGVPEPNALQYVSSGFFAVPNVGIYVIWLCARAVLRPGGCLHGAQFAYTLLPTKERRRLKRSRVLPTVVGSFMLLLNTFPTFINTVVSSGDLISGDVQKTTQWLSNVCLAFSTLIFPLFAFWCLAKQIATSICNHLARVITDAIETTDPRDEKTWQYKVVEPCRQLHALLEMVPATVGLGLGRIFGCMWCADLAFLEWILNAPWVAGLKAMGQDTGFIQVFMPILTLAPLALCYAVAVTGSNCDQLVQALNKSRWKHGKDAHLTIDFLEVSLGKLNNGQGIGISIFGMVIDRKKLAAIAIGLGGALTALLTILFTLSEESELTLVSSAGACGLESWQTDDIKSVIAGGNCSSFENMTLAAVFKTDDDVASLLPVTAGEPPLPIAAFGDAATSVCRNYLEEFDGIMRNADGSFSSKHRLMNFMVLNQISIFPPIWVAVANNALIFLSTWGLSFALQNNMAWAPHGPCGSQAGEPLARLGAGSLELLAEDVKELEEKWKVKHPLGKAHKGELVFTTMVYMMVCAGGWGPHEDAMWNRLAVVLWWVCSVPWQFRKFSISFSLQLASMLPTVRVDKVIESVEKLKLPMDTERWETEVAAPARNLIETMDALSQGWVPIMGVGLIYDLVGGPSALACFAMSSTVDAQVRNFGRHGPTVLSCFFAFICIMVPFQVKQMVIGPASVTTKCELLKEKLNRLRIRDASPESDKRVSHLVRTLTSINGGHGIGFKVLGFVVDKRLLNKLISGLLALVTTFLIPMLLSPQDVTIETTQITMVQTENAQLRSMLGFINDTLYSNQSCVMRFKTDDVTSLLPVSAGEPVLTAAAFSAASTICPNYVEGLDLMMVNADGSPTAMMINADGSPTAKYKLIFAVLVPLQSLFAFGSPFLLSIGGATEADDAPMLLFAVLFGVFAPFQMYKPLRIMIGSRPESLLAQLGAGRAEFTPEEAQGLERSNKVLHPITGKHIKSMLIQNPVQAGLFGIRGWGFHSALHTRITWVIWAVISTLAPGLVLCALLSLKIACKLTKSAVGKVVRAVDGIKSPLEETTRQLTVSRPDIILSKTFDLLNGGWSVMVFVFAIFGFAFILSCPIMVVSPTLIASLRAWGGNTAVIAFQAGFGGMSTLAGTLGTYALLSAPAFVSSTVGDLKQALCRLRLRDDSALTNERVSRRRRAMDERNDGHGIGFRMLGMVVDKRLLNQVFSALFALVTTFLIPMLLPQDVNIASNDAQMASLRSEFANMKAHNDHLQSMMLSINSSCVMRLKTDDFVTPPTTPQMRLTAVGATVPASRRLWFAEQANLTINGGGAVFTGPAYAPPNKKYKPTARYYYPDNHTDPRTHYGLTVVRDFFYTFSMAPDLMPPENIANTLDYFLSGESKTGEVSEGGVPPKAPINDVVCWDEGPFLTLSAAKYATLFGDSAWLCGEHPAGGARLQRLQKSLEFLTVSSQPGQPHLVTGRPHGGGKDCMYGFTDMEPKEGPVLFTSLLVIQAGLELAVAVATAAAAGAQGCIGPGAGKPFAELAARVNASIAAGHLDDPRGSGRLLLATAAGHDNSQPDVWGSGLAVAIGAGTDAQRAGISRALAEGADSIFRWGQARHLPFPLCWEQAGLQRAGAANPNTCLANGTGSYQNGGYWATPLGWLLPAVAAHNATLAAGLLEQVLADFERHGINEAVNHEFVYSTPPAKGPRTYVGTMGYLASAASVYSAIWEPMVKSDDEVTGMVGVMSSEAAARPPSAPLRVTAFGADPTGRNDSTAAIQATVEAAKATTGTHLGGAVSILFPAGRYIISDVISLSTNPWGAPHDQLPHVQLHAEGVAVLAQLHADRGILYHATAHRVEISGLHFEGGRHQLEIGNNNTDKGMIVIRGCTFTQSSGVAIKNIGPSCMAAACPVPRFVGSFSTQLVVRECVFEYCDQVLVTWSDWGVFEDSWITTSPTMFNKSVIENHGRLHVDNILGVPQNMGMGHNNMGNTSNASRNRWFDNYSHRIDGGILQIRGFRFGGEREGITAVVNYAPFVCKTIQSAWEEQMCGRVARGGEALPHAMRGAVGSSIVIENSEFSGSDLAKIYSAEIVLEELPMQLVVKNCLVRSLVNSAAPMALVRVSPDIDLNGPYVRSADTVKTPTGYARPAISIELTEARCDIADRVGLPHQLQAFVVGTRAAVAAVAPPTAGSWKRGAVVRNLNESSPELGWVCVASGWPGRWKSLLN